ncbi:polyprenyl diphosphate synthase [Sandaracinobacter sp. RS1-74]|uniref:polyprenyl diphosphate synthase n=1 Tax=Sandaracinobacteroides sayramensis TaxID=2913411 RepID=UPI001EDB4125|nr:polyprenyl diphosphate synthase [Sandaracinobacteroides sayramensis]MCG2841652.1 polyprenyl diphosphate synthase [Sandaracinobacteroides sayramensis]
MDGNGRWAKARHLPRLAGHRAGVEAVRRIVRAAPRLGIETLTLYAFSSENWRRPAEEVSDLMSLLRHHLLAELDELHANGARLSLIGDWRSLKPDVVERLEAAVRSTAANERFRLVVALNYGGQDELTRAVQAIAGRAAAGEIAPADISPQMIENSLDTADLQPVDLIIRTSGEQRLSNFLLWQAAYAEMWFTPVLWPDFSEATLREAAEAFAGRERRYGGR